MVRADYMLKRIRTCYVLLLLGVVRVYSTEFEIGITNSGNAYMFQPTNVVIATGDTVRWVNNGAEFHELLASDSTWWLFADLSPGGTFSRIFTAEGNYTYYCSGFDHSSHTGSISVVRPNLPPSVSLTYPTNGSRFFAPKFLTLQAIASDPDDGVDVVWFLIGTNRTPVISRTGSFSLNVIWPEGEFDLAALAIDPRGLAATSTVAHVTVRNPPKIRLDPPTATNGHVALTIRNGSTGQTCIIEGSSNLVEWMPIRTNTFSDDTLTEIVNLNPSRHNYRVKVLP